MTNLKYLHHLVSLDNLIKITSQKIVLPFYHTISDEKLNHVGNLYPLRSKKQFEDDLDYLCKHYKPIDIKELNNIICNETPLKKPVFHLTFDDGLKELYTCIAPILEQKGIPATFFINTDFVDNKALFYRYKVSLVIEQLSKKKCFEPAISKHLRMNGNDVSELKKRLLSFTIKDELEIDSIAKLLEIDFDEYLDKNQPYIDKFEIKELIDKGFTIGSHSLNHPFFKNIDLEEKKRQIIESFNYLERELDIKDFYFSFPFSDESVDGDFFRWLYNDANCKLSFGISGLKQDISKFHLHRIPFEYDSHKAQDIVKSEYIYYIIKSLFNKNKISRQ